MYPTSQIADGKNSFLFGKISYKKCFQAFVSLVDKEWLCLN